MRSSGREDPQQQSWIAIQRVVAETWQRRVIRDGELIKTDQEADFLADRIADDLMSLAPLVPAEHWVT